MSTSSRRVASASVRGPVEVKAGKTVGAEQRRRDVCHHAVTRGAPADDRAHQRSAAFHQRMEDAVPAEKVECRVEIDAAGRARDALHLRTRRLPRVNRDRIGGVGRDDERRRAAPDRTAALRRGRAHGRRATRATAGAPARSRRRAPSAPGDRRWRYPHRPRRPGRRRGSSCASARAASEVIQRRGTVGGRDATVEADRDLGGDERAAGPPVVQVRRKVVRSSARGDAGRNVYPCAGEPGEPASGDLLVRVAERDDDARQRPRRSARPCTEACSRGGHTVRASCTRSRPGREDLRTATRRLRRAHRSGKRPVAPSPTISPSRAMTHPTAGTRAASRRAGRAISIARCMSSSSRTRSQAIEAPRAPDQGESVGASTGEEIERVGRDRQDERRDPRPRRDDDPGRLHTSAWPRVPATPRDNMPKPRPSRVAHATDCLDDPGRLAVDHRSRAFRREVARPEPGAAGRHDETGEAVAQPAERGGDCVRPVGGDRVGQRPRSRAAMSRSTSARPLLSSRDPSATPSETVRTLARSVTTSLRHGRMLVTMRRDAWRGSRPPGRRRRRCRCPTRGCRPRRRARRARCRP